MSTISNMGIPFQHRAGFDLPPRMLCERQNGRWPVAGLSCCGLAIALRPGAVKPCSASDLFETGARLVRAIRGIFVLCLAMATHVPVEKL